MSGFDPVGWRRLDGYPPLLFKWLRVGLLATLCATPVAHSKDSSEFWLRLAPWEMVASRDGNFYRPLFLRKTAGFVVGLSQDKDVRFAYRFPYVFRGPAFSRQGWYPTAVADGPDGALYGVAAGRGVFSCGTLFKIDHRGRFTTLHHFPAFAGSAALLVKKSGDVYASTESGVFRIGKDGAVAGLGDVIGHPTHLCETTQQVIMAASVTSYENAQGFTFNSGALSRLNETTGEFEQIADINSPPRALVPTTDGGVLTLTFDRILKFSSAGAMTVLHDFTIDPYPSSSLQPNFITIAQDGSYIGSASGSDGLNVIFRIEPGSNQYSIVRTFSATVEDIAEQWLENVFPIRVAAEGGNHPPAAVDDLVDAASLRSNAIGLPEGNIAVLKNDFDVDRDPLTIVAVSDPAHGTATFDFFTQRVTYTADSPAVENDTFTYTVADGSGGTVTGHVVIRTKQAGRYRGEIKSQPNPASGDPGTVVGNLSVKVNGERQVTARLEFLGKTYRLTAALNEINRCASVLYYDRPTNLGAGVELSLRPSGQHWIVDAVVGRGGYLYYASCPLEPDTP